MKKTKKTSRNTFDLPVNKSTQKSLNIIINGLIASSSVNLSRMAACSGCCVKNESTQKRFSRLLKKLDLDWSEWMRLILSKIPFTRKSRCPILIDRTNWKHGKTHLNILFIVLLFKGARIPVYAVPIGETQGPGNSTAEQVENAISIVINSIGKQRIECVIGDREFGSMRGIQRYKRLGISYCVRLKDQWHHAQKGDQKVLLHELFEDLKIGETRSIKNLKIGSNHPVITDVSAKRLRDGMLLIVAHLGLKKPAPKVYKNRWNIERLFLDLKSQGFHLESTRILNPKRLMNLLAIIAVACAWIYSIYFSSKKSSEPKTKNKKLVRLKPRIMNYPKVSLFKSGLNRLRAQLARGISIFVR